MKSLLQNISLKQSWIELKKAEAKCMEAIEFFYNVTALKDILLKDQNIIFANSINKNPISKISILLIRENICDIMLNASDENLTPLYREIKKESKILWQQINDEIFMQNKFAIKEIEGKLKILLKSLDECIISYLETISEDEQLLNEYMQNQIGLVRSISNVEEANFYLQKHTFDSCMLDKYRSITKLFAVNNNKQLYKNAHTGLLALSSPLASSIILEHIRFIQELYERKLITSQDDMVKNLNSSAPVILYGSLFDVYSSKELTCKMGTDPEVDIQVIQARWSAIDEVLAPLDDMYNIQAVPGRFIDYANNPDLGISPFKKNMKVSADSELEVLNPFVVGNIIKCDIKKHIQNGNIIKDSNKYGFNDNIISHCINISKILQKPVYLQFYPGETTITLALNVNEINTLSLEDMIEKIYVLAREQSILFTERQKVAEQYKLSIRESLRNHWKKKLTPQEMFAEAYKKTYTEEEMAKRRFKVKDDGSVIQSQPAALSPR